MKSRKTKKLEKETRKKEDYLSYYRSRKKKAGGKIPKNTWTASQWHGADETGKQMAKSGVLYRTYKRMKGK